MLSLYVILIVGILTVLIGVASMRDSVYNKDKARSLLNGCKNPALVDLYNAKCNSLSLYGYLAIIYGVVIVLISAYCLLFKDVPTSAMPQKNKTMFVGSVGVIGIGLSLLSLSKKIKSPNPV